MAQKPIQKKLLIIRQGKNIRESEISQKIDVSHYFPTINTTGWYHYGTWP